MAEPVEVRRADTLGEVAGWGVLPPSSRRQQVVDLLREAIVSGDVPSGSQLKQDALCARFGVSPGPVREALRQLGSEGLVEHFPNRGVFVSEVSEDEFLGVLLPVRKAIETYAVPRSALRMSDADFDELAEIVRQMQRLAASGQLRAINELDVRFHELTVEASGSTHAIQLWHTVLPRIRAQIYRLAPRHKDLHEIASEHAGLLDALKTRDRHTVVTAIEHHIVGTAELLLAGAEGETATAERSETAHESAS